MWRDAVKTRLLDEQTRWLAEHPGEAVEILSVTRLTTLLRGGASRRDLYARWGIESHDVSIGEREQTPRKRARVDGQALPTSAIAFASDRVWVTGYVRFERIAGRPTPTTLCLCDAAKRIPIQLANPRYELLDALVVVKLWTVVYPGILDALGWIEARVEPILLHSAKPPPMPICEVQEQLSRYFPAQDPPMYVGPTAWEDVGQDVSSKTGDRSKKRKMHVVFGRILSVSPLAVQDDPTSSHFFIEVESIETLHGVRASVYVLLAGQVAIEWHQFLWPRLVVLLTNLRKVYYSECELFLLQATMFLGKTDVNVTSLSVWMVNETPTRALFHQSNHDEIELEGTVTSIVWDECLMMICEVEVLVSLFHFPWMHIKPHIRVGSRVRITGAHRLRVRLADPPQIALGLCSRSHLRVVQHPDPSSPLLGKPSSTNSWRIQKKWSCFGDFNRQSLSVSMWWLALFEALAMKFSFGTTEDDDTGARFQLQFPCLGRRDATIVIAREVFSVNVYRRLPSTTLATRFLTSHLTVAAECPSVLAGQSCTGSHVQVLTVPEVESFVKELVAAKEFQVDEVSGVKWPIIVEADEMSHFRLIAYIRGCVGASDLEVFDKEGSIPLVLNCDDTCLPIHSERGCSLYAFKRLKAMVELVNHTGGKSRLHAVSLIVSSNDIQRVSLCSGGHIDDTATRCNLVVFVTHISPLKRHQFSHKSLGELRHVSGIGIRTYNSSPNWSSVHSVELLISVNSDEWFLDSKSWYLFESVDMQHSCPDSACGTTLITRINHALRANSKHSEDGKRRDTGATTTSDDQPSMTTYIVDRCSVVSAVDVSDPSSSNAELDLAATSRQTSLRPTSEMLEKIKLIEEIERDGCRVYEVAELFVLQPSEDKAVPEDGLSPIHREPHTARLIDIIGVVMERVLYMRDPRKDATYSSTTRMCRFKIRDRQSLEFINLTVDVDAFGTMSVIQPGTIVQVSKMQCFIARGSFKPFVTWTHCTSMRSLGNAASDILTDSQLFARMSSTLLGSFYKTQGTDRTIKRLTVLIVHMSYVTLKRRCSQCKQPLTLVKRQRLWVHSSDLAEESTNPPVPNARASCSWKQLKQDSPMFHDQTFLSCSLRGIIDDGSGQGELFAENDVAWELLRCTQGQSRRFEELLTRQVSELTFFATKSPTETLFTTPSTQENAYYQNEWRAFVQDAVRNMGTMVVYAQRFYSAQQVKRSTAMTVLNFGKDIQIATPTIPLVQLEAIRVDPANVRAEVRRKLAAVGQLLATTTSL